MNLIHFIFGKGNVRRFGWGVIGPSVGAICVGGWGVIYVGLDWVI